MSGPIVRKYGFPNFDQIFGKRDLEHGTDEPPKAAEEEKKPEVEPAPPKKPRAKKK